MTGRFDANFTSFYDAVQRAVVELKGFDAATGQVNSSVNRMIDNFSGRKIMTEAAIMTEAVERIGGAAYLTADELQQVGAVASEAAAKFRAWGQDVPANIQKYADAAEAASKSTTDWGAATASFTGILGAFGVQLSIGAVVNFTKEIMSAAEELDKLHAKTGINVETLQRFQAAGDVAGNSLEQITGAAIKLTENLAGGKASTYEALDRLGIKAEEFQALPLEQKMLEISKALQTIPDPLDQVKIAFDLMGQKGVEVLPTLKSDIEKVGEAARVMSEQTTTFFANFSNTVKQHSTNARNAIAEFIEYAYGGWTRNERAAKALDDQLKSIGERTMPGLSASFANLIPDAVPNEIDELNNKIDATAAASRQAKVDDEAWMKTMATLHEQTFKLAMDHEKQWREETQKDLAAHNKAVVDGLTQTKDAQQKYYDFLDKSTMDSTDYQIKKIWEKVNADELAFKGSEQQRAAYNKVVEELADAETAHIIAKANEAEAGKQAALQKGLDAEVAAINKSEGTYLEHLDKIVAATAKAYGDISAIVGHRPGEPGSELHAGADIPNGAYPAWWSGPTGAMGGGGSVEQQLKLFLDTVAKYPGIVVNPSGLFTQNMSLPHFQGGGSGDFGSGTPAMLHGREAIVPLDNTGTDLRFGGEAGIVGGSTINLTINITQPLGTPEAIARAVGDAQIALLKGQGVRLPYGT